MPRLSTSEWSKHELSELQTFAARPSIRQRPWIATAAQEQHEAATLSECYARHLLCSLGLQEPGISRADDSDNLSQAAGDWAKSGLMYLTSPVHGAPRCAAHALPSCANGVISALASLAPRAGFEALAGGRLLTERASLLDLSAQGRISPSGACHLMQLADGYLALNLPRSTDWELLGAWLEREATIVSWDELQAQLRWRSVEPLLARGQLLGLALAAHSTSSLVDPVDWFSAERVSHGINRSRSRAPLVVDLSALWAGPLCSRLLRMAGARVIKVESSARPDASRTATPTFFALLNAGKESVQLDFRSEAGRTALATLVASADILIEGSRPRALRQMGIDAIEILRNAPDKIWLSITGYGRDQKNQHRIAFGDDAGVAAGLCGMNEVPGTHSPFFCGDAIADPIAGMHAALAALAFWRSGLGGLLDVSLCSAATHARQFYTSSTLAGTGARRVNGNWHLAVGESSFLVERPIAPQVMGAAHGLGADTDAVLREFAAC